tara:strand:- start:377 stop:1186 length:810 start_codon:yes stop_codon:yes gene_type:complete
MKYLNYDHNWPDSWKMSYSYDLQEVYQKVTSHGYAYGYQNRFNFTLSFAKSVIQQGKNKTVLDVAAGSGNFSLSLAEMGFEVTWNDIREDLIGYVKKKYEYGKITYAPGNILDLRFDKLFDLILITEVIEHVAYPNLFLEHIAKLLAPGGHIVLTTPNGHYFLNQLPKFSECSDPSIFKKNQFGPNSEDHIFLLHLDEIYSFGKDAQLEVISTKFLTNLLTNGHMKLSIILKFLPAYFIWLLEKITTRLPFLFRKKIHTTIAVIYQRKI